MTIFYFIPKTAAIVLPFRWDHVPLGQKRSTALHYFGRPADSLTNTTKTDTWKAERENGEYTLEIHYSAGVDTVADSYTLDFTYKLGFFSKTYRLKSDSIE